MQATCWLFHWEPCMCKRETFCKFKDRVCVCSKKAQPTGELCHVWSPAAHFPPPHLALCLVLLFFGFEDLRLFTRHLLNLTFVSRNRVNEVKTQTCYLIFYLKRRRRCYDLWLKVVFVSLFFIQRRRSFWFETRRRKWTVWKSRIWKEQKLFL